MAGSKGIAGNRKFMDHYYNFGKLSKKLETAKCEDKAKIRHESCQQYINALNVCIQKVKNNNDYMDYIRWNYDIIKKRFSDYLSNCAENFHIIMSIDQRIEEIMSANFHFTETDKAVVNQFTHALDRAKRSGCQKESVYLHAARLYINYVHLLMSKRYVCSTDSDQFTFEKLDSDAKYLMGKLPKCHHLVADIRLANESYAEFRYEDSVLRACQDKKIIDALIFERQKVLCVTLMKHFR